MKSKTEAKRQAILEVAAQAFRELGFERTSMSEICARVGGSKATLYNYFPSKEALFLAVMFQSSEDEFQAVLGLLDASLPDVAEALRRFGRGYLSFLYSPQVLAVRRLMLAEAGRAELGLQCYAQGPQRSEDFIADYLGTAMADGRLHPADPRVATCHLRGLLEGELLEPFIFGVLQTVAPAQIEAVVERAVAAFMAAYGAQG